jgi:hypothetical protein
MGHTTSYAQIQDQKEEKLLVVLFLFLLLLFVLLLLFLLRQGLILCGPGRPRTHNVI